MAAGAAAHFLESRSVDNFFSTAVADDGDDDEKKGAKKKRRALVLPLDCLKLVERRGPDLLSDARRLQDGLASGGGKQPTIVMEVRELVEIIHAAASDPNVTAVYADFGEGMRYPMGYAHIEEVRNAIRVFNESHRVHREPNLTHSPVFALARNGEPKSSFAFGHSFGWADYFLASAFGHVHLQARGNLSLFGHATVHTFLGGMFDRYGIRAHVFRHGEYKSELRMDSLALIRGS